MGLENLYFFILLNKSYMPRINRKNITLLIEAKYIGSVLTQYICPSKIYVLK